MATRGRFYERVRETKPGSGVTLRRRRKRHGKLPRHRGAGAGLPAPFPVPWLALPLEAPATLCGLVPAVGGSLVLASCSMSPGSAAEPLPAADENNEIRPVIVAVVHDLLADVANFAAIGEVKNC